MGKPSVATQKRLYAVSGNRCAFRGCRQPLVDAASGKVTARICHIKGNRPGSKRYDTDQPEEERQGFDNLVLMCPIHHDVIDSDDVVFTVEALRILKAEHEAAHKNDPAPAKRDEELFLANVSIDVTDGSVILSANQSGGQIAHIIHNNYGTAPPPESPFRAELGRRHLGDVEDAEFGRTAYQRRLGWAVDNQIRPSRTTVIIFAHSLRPYLEATDEADFLKWADCNKLRYEPCTRYPFIPGVIPDRIGSALVWNDGGMMHNLSGKPCYSRYLALERAGWMEYGFDARTPIDDRPHVYFARIVANVVGFLSFLRQMAAHRSINPASLSLGFGMTGVKGLGLVCMVEEAFRPGIHTTTPPEENNLLTLRPAEMGPWDSDAVAREFAEAVLNHWSYTRPGWITSVPEFDGEVYRGEFFRDRFGSW